MLNRHAEKYLKPTQIASYTPRIGYARPPMSVRFQPGARRLWKRLAASYRAMVADHVIGNLLLIATLVQAINLPRAIDRTRSLSLTRAAKFTLGWSCALIMLLLCLPLFLVIGLAIKLDSTGPVFFRQERVGMNRRHRARRAANISLLNGQTRGEERRKQNRHGRPFMVYKFRTMVVDAEKRCGPIWATKNDPRVTKVGRILRKTRLDELPQLLNVLRAEMALVGPRPERPFFVEKLAKQIDGYTRRLEVKPGITGLAQVENGYDSSVDSVRAKVDYDLKYITSSNIRRDLVILIKTIGVVLGCRGM